MDKTQILELIDQKIKEGVLSREDIHKVINHDFKDDSNHTKNLTNIFYVIGGIIVVIGVIILLAQNWTEIGFVGRVLSTLGISIVSYVIAYVMTDKIHRILSQVFFTISGILAPIGIVILYREFGLVFNSLAQTCTALAFFVLFYIAYRYSRRNILILWNAVWVTWFYVSLLNYLFIMSDSIIKIGASVLGVSYLLITYYLQNNRPILDNAESKERHRVENILYGTGLLMILIPSLASSGIFDFIMLLLIFGGFYLSIFVRSRLSLIVSACILVAYILKITSKYFVNSTGWSVALILVGFFVIAIGYGTVYLSKKYIPKENKLSM